MSAREQDELISAIGCSPIAIVVSNPRRQDNPLEVVNHTFCALTGYSEAEIVGRNCRFLAGEKTDEAATEELRASIRERRPTLVELTNYRQDGSPFLNGVMITPLFNSDGELAWFLGSQVELRATRGHDLSFEAPTRQAHRQLPSRQRQVLAGMARGLLNKQIAWKLKMSEKTVKMHRALMLDGSESKRRRRRSVWPSKPGFRA